MQNTAPKVPARVIEKPPVPVPAKNVVKKVPQPRPVAPRRPARPVTSKLPSTVATLPTPSSSQQAPQMDMMASINARRAQRQEQEQAAAQENAAARAAEAEPSANDIARANIAFQERKAAGGTNGIFEIVSKGPRVAQYVFRGWTTDARHSQRQTITVDAGLGGNVELAIVNSMIALIRKYYQGDFNWDSQRLGRVVTLSARPEDTAGLQKFLMDEFFDG